jgi:hypothetical protein
MEKNIVCNVKWKFEKYDTRISRKFSQYECIQFFYFSNFHIESSKIIKYTLKNCKIKKYAQKSKNH